jgi:hypothetical protein
MVFLTSLLPMGSWIMGTTTTFAGEELLGKPTDTSITVNIVPNSTIEYYYEYGTTQGGPYPYSTTRVTATGGEPSEVVITELSPNTKYYYRMVYDADGDVDDGDYEVRDEHSFWTQRAPGSTFTFTIIADSHAMYNTQYQQAIQNVIADEPDFHFDLGDTFMTDYDTSQSQVNNEYLAQRGGQYLDLVGHSSPIFLASGNHENEEGWNLNDTFSIALASIQARKAYFPTPITDGFYTGNDDILADIDSGTYGDQYREDYYAWEWGDTLFVVFDPFQYTMANPYGASAGEGSDDPATGDRWNWTLGLQQFNWLKNVLQTSTAKYKFIFAHHMLGGTQNYVRGGAVPAHMFEWGGYNADGTTWGFDTKRPTFGDDPVHQMFVEYGVNAFFHGHDHQYAYEVRDGIVYQCLPRPSTGLDFNYYSESDPYTERVLSGPGHLRVTVTPTETTVEYVTSSSGSGTVMHSYTIEPNDPGTTYELTVNTVGNGNVTQDPLPPYYVGDDTLVTLTATADPGWTFSAWSGDGTGDAPGTRSVTMDGNKSVTATFTAETDIIGNVNGDGIANSTDALIVLSCDVGIDTSAYCPMNCGDVNEDGLINSTDALIILSYDVGISVPYPVGEPGYPSSVTPCPGCSP